MARLIIRVVIKDVVGIKATCDHLCKSSVILDRSGALSDLRSDSGGSSCRRFPRALALGRIGVSGSWFSVWSLLSIPSLLISRARAPGTESNDALGWECLSDARSGDGVLDVGALLWTGERGPCGACGGGARDWIEPCVAMGGA